MTQRPGPGEARELVDRLEAEIVDVDALDTDESPAEPAEDQSGAVPGSAEPTD